MKIFGLVGSAIHVFEQSATFAPPLVWVMCMLGVAVVLHSKNGFGLHHLPVMPQLVLIAFGPITAISAMVTAALAGNLDWMRVNAGRHSKVPDNSNNDWFFER